MPNKNAPAVSCQQEARLIETLPLILRLARARKHNLPDWATIEDLRQTVALNLLKWKHIRPERELSGEEWLKFANTATVNQVGKYHDAAHVRRETQLSELEKYAAEKVAGEGHAVSPVGNTKIEVESLVGQLWKIIETLTLRERCAVLLKADGTLAAIVGRRGCDITGVARALRLERGELFAIIELVPLADEEIAHLLAEKLGEQVSAKQILEARFRAKAKIRRGLDGKNTKTSKKDTVDDESGKKEQHSEGGT